MRPDRSRVGTGIGDVAGGIVVGESGFAVSRSWHALVSRKMTRDHGRNFNTVRPPEDFSRVSTAPEI
jgi:hypothetical protein